jgi:hypothetical protein
MASSTTTLSVYIRTLSSSTLLFFHTFSITVSSACHSTRFIYRVKSQSSHTTQLSADFLCVSHSSLSGFTPHPHHSSAALNCSAAAPIVNAMAEAAFLLVRQLLVRDSTQNSTVSKEHAGKTDAQWEAEGRYNYPPSFAAAVVFLALYVIITGFNLFQYIFYRAWFWWPMVFAILRKSFMNLLDFQPPIAIAILNGY